MTNLYLALGLLLLLTTCNAHVHGIDASQPENCCFDFTTMNIKMDRIETIKETGYHCTQKGFVVRTKKGKEYCFRHTVKWVEIAFNKQQLMSK